MAKIVINQDKIADYKELIKLCPFNAIEYKDNTLSINAGCKMCKLCIKKGPKGVFELIDEVKHRVNKDDYRGILVYVDHTNGEIHPVTYELIGKALELASKINHPVYCLFMGDNISDKAEDILNYGVNEVFVYNKKELKDFRIEPYTSVFSECIENIKPSIVLVGGTIVGRSLAPRVAARFKTGLTADCTILDVQENTDLDQIRPAFGGNIMAHIFTPNHRPQFATVRYKIFSAPEKIKNTKGKITMCDISGEKLMSKISVLKTFEKEKKKNIEDADVIIAVGRALKRKEDLDMIYKIAEKLNAEVACTRPLIESNWLDAKKQIGLSGRTVKPRLIITCGISGAIQFTAGMNNSDCIIAINNDEKAPIFQVAHYAVIGDMYDVLPKLADKIACELEVCHEL
ncbi:FAD-binding protein [Clostridiaceae bacterium M8S5]|nr:FAD-binding protein [Clostridiaceae bacterium M8S5]